MDWVLNGFYIKSSRAGSRIAHTHAFTTNVMWQHCQGSFALTDLTDRVYFEANSKQHPLPSSTRFAREPCSFGTKRLSLRRPESVLFCTVPIATRYAEPCHSWSVLYRPHSCFLGDHRSMQIVPCLLVHTMPRLFQLRDFIDQDTGRRSSDFQRVHTRRV